MGSEGQGKQEGERVLPAQRLLEGERQAGGKRGNMSIVVSSSSAKGLGKGGRLRTIRERTARGQQAK